MRRRARKRGRLDDDQFERDLLERVLQKIRLADHGEEARRRSDRIGANTYYSRHWNVYMPDSRAALTVNVAKRLIDHKIAIMTKQEPTWVVEADDVGDAQAARLMRAVLQRQFEPRRNATQARRALHLAEVTRTVGAKTFGIQPFVGGLET